MYSREHLSKLVDGETRNLRPALCHPRWIPEKSGECYTLFVVVNELQEPKSTTATTVSTRQYFLSDSAACSITYGSMQPEA